MNGHIDPAAAAQAARQRVYDSFGKQTVMAAFGARLCRVEPGQVDIELPFRPDLCQQNGYLHAGIGTTIADSAGGYAALSLFEPGEDVLTSEFKMNFLAPADGERFLATGRVLKAGRRLAVCQVEVIAYRGGQATQCVAGLMTAVRVTPR
ncbi:MULTISPECIES: PaaI family thioesterase [Bordetella]|uniref:Medium/long-chain acyl-CoA thioesterase YigI n=2 Tax=Bordetella TaxID=517 RepID=A0A261VPD8_9BORD|nr:MULTISPECIES: PaaI family thioesterase [Bordetella]MDM9557528.1 PaaI family thioesterase [Bordetella petrii]OZI75919.1 thioesterase [Bordetella genomosp. 2]